MILNEPNGALKHAKIWSGVCKEHNRLQKTKKTLMVLRGLKRTPRNSKRGRALRDLNGLNEI